MKIAIGSDHAGFDYKVKVKVLLQELGHETRDFGTFNAEPVDYPVFIRPVAEAVARGEFERGIVLGGSGNGEAIVANKVKGIRCALCWNLDTARWAREHNDANVLAIGGRIVAFGLADEILTLWLSTARRTTPTAATMPMTHTTMRLRARPMMNHSSACRICPPSRG